MALTDDEELRLFRYLKGSTARIRRQIGFGIHGKVFELRLDGKVSIIKLFYESEPYHREKSVYLRLLQTEKVAIGEFSVPEMLGFNDQLNIIEMSMVTRPFCLDFASAYLDHLPPGFPEFGSEWENEKCNQFGEEDWDKVKEVLRELRDLGIIQTDVSPSNIAPREID